MSRMSDLHFIALESIINQQDNNFLFQTFGSEFNLFLKIYKCRTDLQQESLLKFFPAVYTLVQKIGKSVLKVSLLSYNEEVIEESAFQVDPEQKLEESVLRHILSSLKREYRACPGVTEASIQTQTLDKLLIERYGDAIFHRSRDCSRLILDPSTGSCYNCRALQGKSELLVKNEEEEREEAMEAVAREGKRRSGEGEIQGGSSCSYVCLVEECRQKFKRENLLASHLLQHHPDHHQQLSGSFHKCPQEECFTVFRHWMGKKMMTHLQAQHEVDGRQLEAGLKSTVCSYCAKVFNTPVALRRHVQNTHEAPVIPCHICGTSIRGTQNLNVHLRVTHGNVKFKCPEPGCTVEAKNKDHLKDHIAAIHRNSPRYICSICGTRYKYRSKWKYCEDKHRGKFLHECTLCDKKFNDKRKFRIHQRVHTGEKPYMCPICSIRMARLDNLNAHTKKTHGMTWREAEKMTESTISGIPVSEHQKVV